MRPSLSAADLESLWKNFDKDSMAMVVRQSRVGVLVDQLEWLYQRSWLEVPPPVFADLVGVTADTTIGWLTVVRGRIDSSKHHGQLVGWRREHQQGRVWSSDVAN